MNLNLRKTAGAGRVAALISLAGALLLSGGVGVTYVDAQGVGNGPGGTWVVRVTLRNCDTNASLGSFGSLVTFHAGGTLSESTSSPGFAIGQRSPGHGTWNLQAPRSYRQRMINLINFDTAPNLPGTPGFDPTLPVTPGFFAGWGIVTHTLEITDADHMTSSGTNEFYRADGTLYRTGCSTAVSTRFE